MTRKSKPDGVPQSTLDHFETIPWCSELLNDPTFQIIDMSRTVTQPGGGHSLFADTLSTPNTIAQLLSFYRPPGASKGQSAEVCRFYTFGSGLNAHPNTLHGGIVAAILDSTMSNAGGMEVRSDLGKETVFTVGLNISYKKPIPTPSTILARAWVAKIEGRKVWVEGSLESGAGEVYAKAEGVWLKAGPKM